MGLEEVVLVGRVVCLFIVIGRKVECGDIDSNGLEEFME